MKRLFVWFAAITFACSDGGSGPTAPNTPSIAGTYQVSATTVTNTCGPAWDFDDELDGEFVQIRHDRNSYTMGFENFIPALVNGYNLQATQTLIAGDGSAVMLFDLDFASDGRSFDGTVDIDVTRNTGEICTVRMLLHGERD